MKTPRAMTGVKRVSTFRGMTRRGFLARGAGLGLGLGLGLATGRARAACGGRDPGPLRPPDAHGLRLPAGARSRIVARSGEPPVAGGTWRWHAAPDGGAVFPAPRGGWLYVSNSEMPDGAGGVGVLHFDAAGRVVDAWPVLTGTRRNCAGGATPWGTWLSCEEVDDGLVWECDPFRRATGPGAGDPFPRPLPQLGRFAHEAAAVDPVNGHVYLTEDKRDGLLYRFVPDGPLRTAAGLNDHGTLEAFVAIPGMGGRGQWAPVPDPGALTGPLRHQLRQARRFGGGEGIDWQHGRVVFVTKFDEQVWDYDTREQRLAPRYRGRPGLPLRQPDNLLALDDGRVLVAEDGDDLQIVLLGPDGAACPLLQLVGHAGSELTGPALTPNGRRLYFSSQRGSDNDPHGGVTFEVILPRAAWGPLLPVAR